MINKSNLIAMGVENETTANFNGLLEDEDFKKLATKELKSKNNVAKSVKILSKYANENLI